MKSVMKMMVAAALGAAMCTAAASADVWYFDTYLTGDQHNPPTGSQGTGHCIMKYDDVTNLLDIDLYIEGFLPENLLYAHLHQGRAGFYGDMIAHLGHGHMFMPDGNGLRRIATGIPIDEMYEDDIISEGAYVNVHTVQFEAGEIRSQTTVVPRLSTTALARGQRATFDVLHAQANERIYFLYSMTGLGAGPSIPALGGMTLDILTPVNVIGSAVSNQQGHAAMTVLIPANAPSRELVLQAVIRRGVDGADSVKSNTISTAILP
ncbi:MAG: CHRD domain-containing protein [Phycisphaerales bacterium]|nr:CHRD domain-containing protein [Phycisphaerales bacterium]